MSCKEHRNLIHRCRTTLQHYTDLEVHFENASSHKLKSHTMIKVMKKKVVLNLNLTKGLSTQFPQTFILKDMF